MYRHYIASGRLVRGDVNAFAFEVIILAYVLLPTLVGSFVGSGQRRKWRLAL